LTLTAIGIAAALNYHIVPGFHNLQITPAFYLNFDNPLIGLFPLVFLIPICQTKEEWIKVGLKSVPLILLFIFGLAAVALGTGILEWDMKFPSHFLIRILSNMFLTVIPEEAFFRGFLQKDCGFFPQVLGESSASADSALAERSRLNGRGICVPSSRTPLRRL
jgi:hypothetical protein